MYKSMKAVDSFASTIKKNLQELTGAKYKVKVESLSESTIGSILVHVAEPKATYANIAHEETLATYVVDVFRGGFGKQRYLRVMEMRKDYAQIPVPVELSRSYSDGKNLAQAIWTYDLDPRIFERAVNKLNVGE